MTPTRQAILGAFLGVAITVCAFVAHLYICPANQIIP